MKRFAVILLSIGGLVVAQLASAQEADPSRVRDAAARALVAIQKAQESWYTTNKQVCASCHHQYQPALAYRVARDHSVPFNESITRADAAKAFNFSDIDRAIQVQLRHRAICRRCLSNGGCECRRREAELSHGGLRAPSDSRQNARGDWDGFHQRPPSSYSPVTMAALGLRAVQLYHHASQKAQADAAVVRALTFLESRTPRDTEERSYQLLGLRWAGAPRSSMQSLARDLKGTQRADGGWNSVAGRESDVYSTAQALVALRDGGGVAIIDVSYQRGVEFLLKTQAADGTWQVVSRLHPPAPLSPPYFDAGYPHGHDQFLSMQGASWAVMALSYALEPAKPVVPPALPDRRPASSRGSRR